MIESAFFYKTIVEGYTCSKQTVSDFLDNFLLPLLEMLSH